MIPHQLMAFVVVAAFAACTAPVKDQAWKFEGSIPMDGTLKYAP